MIDDAADRQRHDEGGDCGDDQSEDRERDRQAIAAEERQEPPERLQARAGRPGRGEIFGRAGHGPPVRPGPRRYEGAKPPHLRVGIPSCIDAARSP